jgi:hypothetical protein
MTINNKDFKVKNGLQVSGPAVFGSDVILGNTPLAFDSGTNRLKIQVNNEWVSIATLADADVLTFEDIGLTIDYDGQPTYIVQGNGITPSITSKFVDGGDPNTTSVRYIFDAQVVQ